MEVGGNLALSSPFLRQSSLEPTPGNRGERTHPLGSLSLKRRQPMTSPQKGADANEVPRPFPRDLPMAEDKAL